MLAIINAELVMKDHYIPEAYILLKDGKIEKLPVMLPQTQEKGTATLFLNKDKNFMAELMNFKRDDNA